MICEHCNQKIITITTDDGRKIRCEVAPVYFRVSGKGQQMFFTLRGEAFQGDICTAEKATGYAYLSHFSICKARQRLKKKVENGEQMRMNV